MIAAQHQFGHSALSHPHMQQQQQQQQQQHTSPPDDQQEVFLRSLFSTPAGASPPSSLSAAGSSYVTSPPPAIAHDSAPSMSSDSSNSGLSPLSNASFQNIQDFLYGRGSESSTSTSTSNQTVSTADGMNGSSATGSMPMPMLPPTSAPVDQHALEYFLKSINGFNGANQTSGPDQMHQTGYGMPPHHYEAGFGPLFVPSGETGGPVPVAPFNFTLSNGMLVPSFGHAPMGHHLAAQQQYQHSPQHHLQQQQQQQHQGPQHAMQHPALDSRKRSAPDNMMPSQGPPYPMPQANAVGDSPAQKRSRGSSQLQPKDQMSGTGMPASATAGIPRMEVGSNATALAAIERLKATKQAAAARLESQARQQASAGAASVKQEHGSSSSAPRQEKKVAHNAIERRYRNNINARIAALRNAVPALRELRPKKPTRKGKEALPEDLVDGVPAATKLNKATILGKATDYIRYLKGRETRLASEVAGMRELIRSLEGGEELLELWQDEMERVVAAQQEQQRLQQQLEDDAEYDEDDGDDDEDEEGEIGSSSSSSSAAARYMMGITMGFTVMSGSSSEEHFAAGSSHTAGRVIGASHQLLKRGMTATNVKLGSVAHVPHHLDLAPSHHLLVEVLRGIALVGCLLFVFWPAITHLLPQQWQGPSKQKRKQINAFDASRLATLKASSAGPAEEDAVLRHCVGAPNHAVVGGLGLVTLALREVAYRVRLIARPRTSLDEAACWAQLLELETSMGPLAQRSLLARLHTLATVATLRDIGQGGLAASGSPTLLSPARMYGTMAVATVRASSGSAIAAPLAERFWTMARRCRLLADQDDGNVSNLDASQMSMRWLDATLELPFAQALALCPSPTIASTRCTPTCDTATRTTSSSPLMSIAANQHMQQLADIWSVLLCQVAASTCPTSQDGMSDNEDPADDEASSFAAFAKHMEDAKMSLACLADEEERDSLSARIARLTLTTPPCADLQTMSNVVFGTWALLVGNVGVARSIAVVLAANKDGAAGAAAALSRQPLCAQAYVSLVLGPRTSLPIFEVDTKSSGSLVEVDALALATLSWLSFLRAFAMPSTATSNVASASLAIRRQLAVARAAKATAAGAQANQVTGMTGPAVSLQALSSNALLPRGSIASTSSSVSWNASESGDSAVTSSVSSQQRSLDGAIDALTDVLTVLGRRAALCEPKSTAPATTLLSGKGLDVDGADSGVEWGSA